MTAPFCRRKAESEMLKDELDFRSSLLIQQRAEPVLYPGQHDSRVCVPSLFSQNPYKGCLLMNSMHRGFPDVYVYSRMHMCVHMFVQGRRSHWVPSSLLSILFFGGRCRLSHQQTPAVLLLCLHNTVTTAVQLHQLLGSGRLNSDPMSTHLILYEPSHHASSMF